MGRPSISDAGHAIPFENLSPRLPSCLMSWTLDGVLTSTATSAHGIWSPADCHFSIRPQDDTPSLPHIPPLHGGMSGPTSNRQCNHSVLYQQAGRGAFVEPLSGSYVSVGPRHSEQLPHDRIPHSWGQECCGDWLNTSFLPCHEWWLHSQVAEIIFQRWGTP